MNTVLVLHVKLPRLIEWWANAYLMNIFAFQDYEYEFQLHRASINFRHLAIPKEKSHFCTTNPTGVPGGLVTSSSWRQHGKQHPVHLRGLCKWITSLWELSKIFISKGRPEPQQILVQQSVSVVDYKTEIIMIPNNCLISRKQKFCNSFLQIFWFKQEMEILRCIMKLTLTHNGYNCA